MRFITAFIAFSACVVVGAQSRADLRRLVGHVEAGQVTRVVDGDTVHVTLDGGRAITVRLDGIDAPEQREPFSTTARNAARVMLFDQHVQVKGTDVDRYDRLVARVVVNGADSSVALVSAGLACHYTQYSSDPVLAAAQREARTAGRGFWAAGAQKPACVANTATPARQTVVPRRKPKA